MKLQSPRLSLEKICRQVEQGYFQETGNAIKLASSSLDRHVKGRKCPEEAGESKGEAEEVVKYIQQCADRGTASVRCHSP